MPLLQHIVLYRSHHLYQTMISALAIQLCHLKKYIYCKYATLYCELLILPSLC